MKKKVRLENFAYYDAQGIENHLTSMAEKGWLLCDITGLWIYQRIEARKLKFAVTYFNEANDYNPYPTSDQEVFMDYCEAAGWHLIASNSQMQIFYSNDEESIPIETDEEIKLALIHAAMKKILFFWCVLLVIIISNIALSITQCLDSPLRQLSNTDNFIFVLIDVWALLLIIHDIVRYRAWYECSKQSAALGGGCCEVKKRNLLFNPLIPISVLLLIGMLTHSYLLLIVLCLCCLVIIASSIIGAGITKILKKHGATYWENVSVSSLSVLVCIFVLMYPIAAVIEGVIESDRYANSKIVTTTDQFNNTKEWVYFQDELPLTLADMNVLEDSDYSYEKEEQSSFLLSYLQGKQRIAGAGNMKDLLVYEIVDMKTAMFYELCLNELMHNHLNNGTYWQEVDEPLWQADVVYRIYHDGQPFMNQYLICWENRIVKIEFMREVSENQLTAAADKLKHAGL